MATIETTNRQIVGMQGELITVQRPAQRMTADEALVHAAYLVSLAEPFATSDFKDVLDAVQTGGVRVRANREGEDDIMEKDIAQLKRQLEIMDGALAIAARMAAAIGPLIPRPEDLTPDAKEKWQKVIDTVFEAADYADLHKLEQWGGKAKFGPQAVK